MSRLITVLGLISYPK